MEAVRARSLQAFRNLLRAQRVTFGTDMATRLAALQKTREEFLKKRDLTAEEEISKAVKLADEVAETLRRNVVQAVKQPHSDQQHQQNQKQSQTNGEEAKAFYRMQIRPETELNDRLPQGMTLDKKYKPVKCCSSKD
ncbi:hypothetical protein GQ42DRAFT_126285 [Ramicandelaber brevisporus]|nr:hypothetical protein GQ42DRAFT_126285 [Ramicandelaber brevisporus]